MSDPNDARDEAEVLLGIDLRNRAERLINAAEAFAKAAQTLRKIAVWALGLGLVLLGAQFVLWVGVRASVDSGHDVRDQIASCVTPGRACYERSQQQTASLVTALVAAINQDGVVRAACAQNEAGVNEPIAARIAAIGACVQAHLPK